MKKLIYSLIALAGLFTLASCQPDKLIGDKDGGDGKAANISITVSLGPKTKAFADGTKADKLYAGLYEMGANSSFTYVTHTTTPIDITSMRATVTFNGKVHRGNSYRLVFWAQTAGAPYTIDWATAATTGPTVTVNTYTGNSNLANDDTRDAFFGFYDAENVQGDVSVTEQNAIQLKRPFAQVNVLVPIANITTPAGAVASTMTVAQAPTVLNLATKATSAPEDWAFASNAIDEDPFAAYAPNDPGDPATHKYVAMNYVLVDQLTADARYDVGFTVSASAGVQTSGDKAVANVPLKPNGRTNIVGNVFADDFNISVPIIVSPGAGTEQELTTVTVAVGGMDEANAISLTDAYNSGTPLDIDVAVNHPITLEADKPEITVTPASVATAEWVLGTGLRVTPLVENGKAVITLVFPAVTKTAYAAATAQIYIKVGNGQNAVATPTFSPGAGEVAQGTPVTITSTTEGASIYYTTNGDEPTNASTLYEDPVVINSACTIKAIAIKDGLNNSAVAEAAYTLAPKPAQTLTVKVGDDTVGATLDKTYGDAGFSLTVTGNEGGLTYESATSSVATISNGGAISIVGAGSSILTVTAAETASYAETSKLITLIVAQKAAGLVLDDDKAEVTEGQTVYVPYAVESDGVISVASSDEAKATASVDTQNERIVINGVAAGSATVTVSIAAGSNYAALTPNQEIAVTVTAAQVPTYAVNLAAMTNGSVTRDKETAAANETVTLTIAPDAGYALGTIAVKKAGDVDVALSGTGNTRTFTMPAEAVTVSATFEHVGQGTQADPFTVAGVRAYIDSESYSATAQVYVSGVVSETPQTPFADGAAVFWITADGNPSDEKFEAYKLNYIGGNTFAAGNPDIAQGNSVILYGKVTKYNTTYETKQSEAYLYSLNGKTAITQTPTITGAGDVTVVPAGEGTLEITLASEQGATIYYTLDGSVPTAGSTEYSSPFTINAACTIKAIAFMNEKLSSAITTKVFTKDGGATQTDDVSYDFTSDISDFASWGTSYSAHLVSFTEANVNFTDHNHQTGTITDCPVGKGAEVTLVLKKGTMSAVNWTCTQWGTKAQTITLHYSTDGGSNYSSTGVTSTNFSIGSNSLPAGTNAVKITFSNASNQVGISGVSFTYTYSVN